MLHSIYLVMIRCHYPLPWHQLPPHFIRMLTLSTGSPLGFNSFFWTTPPLSLVGLWNPVSSCPTPCRWPPTPLGLWCPSAVGCYHGPPTWTSSHPPVPWHRSLLTSVWTSSFQLRLPQLPLFYHTFGLISSASPNATQIFHFEEFCQISSQRDSVNSYPTINAESLSP